LKQAPKTTDPSSAMKQQAYPELHSGVFVEFPLILPTSTWWKKLREGFMA
jgi:hypothetical protein